MNSLMKFILGCAFFSLGIGFYGRNNDICSFISFALVFFIFIDLRKHFQQFYYGKDGYYKSDENYPYYDYYDMPSSEDSIYYDKYKPKHNYVYSEHNEIEDIIKGINAKLNKKHNFVQFCGDKSFNKEIIQIPNYNGTILIDNKENEKVLSIISEIIDKIKLKLNEKYALLESFFYIGVTETNIDIYIDQFLFKKTNLSEDHLCLKKIYERLKAEYPNKIIQTHYYENNNLLNFYIKKNNG